MICGVGFVLLAGGQSRRMGGGDKNQLKLGNKSVLQHVRNKLEYPEHIQTNGSRQQTWRFINSPTFHYTRKCGKAFQPPKSVAVIAHDNFTK